MGQPVGYRGLRQQPPPASHLGHLAHCGYGEWDKGIGIARTYPHVYLELTGAHDLNGIIEKMVAEADKMLYGTDLPWFDPHYVIGCVLCSHISDDDRHNILHRTAERLLAPFLGSSP